MLLLWFNAGWRCGCCRRRRCVVVIGVVVGVVVVERIVRRWYDIATAAEDSTIETNTEYVLTY